MVRVGNVVRVEHMDNSVLSCLGLVLHMDRHLQTAVVSLVADSHFPDSSSLEMGSLHLFAGAQTTVWTCQLSQTEFPALEKNHAEMLLSWPSIKRDWKISIAEKINLRFNLGRRLEEPTPGFQSLIESMSEISSELFETFENGMSVSAEWYYGYCQKSPSRAALLAAEMTEMARREQTLNRSRLQMFRQLSSDRLTKDAARILLRRELNTQNRLNGGSAGRNYALMASERGLKSLAIVSNASSKNPKVYPINGVPIRVHKISLGV